MSKLSRRNLLSGAATALTASALPLSDPANAAGQADETRLGPDSQPQAGVPQGDVTHFVYTSPRVFPGTQRDVWVYVPKQSRPDTPAAVMIFQDGGGFQDRNGGFRVPVVFDNLIARGEMPPTVAVMLNPGVVPAARPDALPRFNRSFEYDAPTDQYARFLLEEMLPEVEKRLAIKLTTDPNLRGLCGASSGGIASFTAAWERPDAFRRVVSGIGSFTDLRGGNTYPSQIRKYEPKPLRVFLQDGRNDQDIYSGSWPIGNRDVAAALQHAHYDHRYMETGGGHDGRYLAALFPDALRFVWRDWQKPIPVPTDSPQRVMQFIAPGETWQPPLPIANDAMGDNFAVNPNGEVYFCGTNGFVFRLEAAGTTLIAPKGDGGIVAIAFGPDGRLYASHPDRKVIIAYDKAGKPQTIVRNVVARSLIVAHSGLIAFVDGRNGGVGTADSKGKRLSFDPDADAHSITLTPDQTLLVATPRGSGNLAASYRLEQDGKLSDRQLFYDLRIPYGAGATFAGGMATDTNGWLYVASRAGIQVCDQAGRVNGILANPTRGTTTGVAFGGPNRDILYTICDGKIYRRQMRAKGVLSFEPPVKPPAPQL